MNIYIYMCLIDLLIDFAIELGSIDFGFDFLGGSCRGCWEIPVRCHVLWPFVAQAHVYSTATFAPLGKGSNIGTP